MAADNNVAGPPEAGLDWYLAISKERDSPPRCPFASVHRCPRYYQSLALMSEAGNTAIDPDVDGQLLKRWQSSDLWPVTREQATSIAGRPGEPHHFMKFCPEVAYDNFGFFASDLHRHADEIDVDVAHRELARRGAPRTDWRWSWSYVAPMHYSACPLYAPLLREGPAPTGGSMTRQDVLNAAAALAARRVPGWASNRSAFAAWAFEAENLFARVFNVSDPPLARYRAALERYEGSPQAEKRHALPSVIGAFDACKSVLDQLPAAELESRLLDQKIDRPDPSPPATGAASRSLSADASRAAHPRRVAVVHGRNAPARNGMFIFLRSLHLEPIEWGQGVRLTGEGSPYVGTVIDKLFEHSQAVVVLLTGDEEVVVREPFREQPEEAEPQVQARPNVLFEAGMAFGVHAPRTILVQIGPHRPFSDIGGRHVLRFDDGAAPARHELAQRLSTAGCPVDTSGQDWLRAGGPEFAEALRLASAPLAVQEPREHAETPPALVARIPRVVIRFVGNGDTLRCKLVRPITRSPEERAALASEMRSRHPPLTPPSPVKEEPKAEPTTPAGRTLASFVAAQSKQFSEMQAVFGEDQEPAEKYNASLERYHTNYAAWLDKSDEHTVMMARLVTLELQILNEGTAPGNDVDVTIDAPADVAFYEEDDKALRAPAEPVVPKRKAIPKFDPRSGSLIDRPFLGSLFNPGNVPSPNRYEGVARERLTAWTRKLKHGDDFTLTPFLMIWKSEPRPVTLRYTVSMDELPTKFVGELTIIPEFA